MTEIESTETSSLRFIGQKFHHFLEFQNSVSSVTNRSETSRDAHPIESSQSGEFNEILIKDEKPTNKI